MVRLGCCTCLNILHQHKYAIVEGADGIADISFAAYNLLHMFYQLLRMMMMMMMMMMMLMRMVVVVVVVVVVLLVVAAVVVVVMMMIPCLLPKHGLYIVTYTIKY